MLCSLRVRTTRESELIGRRVLEIQSYLLNLVSVRIHHSFITGLWAMSGLYVVPEPKEVFRDLWLLLSVKLTLLYSNKVFTNHMTSSEL